MKPTILILNGPPECGKDTIGKMLHDQIGCALTSFKFDLYAETAKHFSVDIDWLIHKATDREFKDVKQFSMLGSRTPRGALIHVSEDVCKPEFGNDYFGKLSARRIVDMMYINPIEVIVFTDGGFKDEIPPLQEVGEVYIIQLKGRGSFEGDSRSFINLPSIDTLTVNLVDGKPQQAVDDILSAMGGVL
jgi:hypothetical protein